MIATQLLDTFMATISQMVLYIITYKYLKPKKQAKYVRFAFPVFIGIVYYIIKYSNFFIQINPSISVRYEFFPVILLGLLLIYIIFCFNSSKKQKSFAFIANILTILFAEQTVVAILVMINVDIQKMFNLGFWDQLFYNLFCLGVYIAYGSLIYFITKNRKVKLPWFIIFYIGLIIISCAVMFWLCANLFDVNIPYTKFAIAVSSVCLVALTISIIKIVQYTYNQLKEKENTYWLNKIHNINIEYYNSFNKKSNEIRKIQHDISNNLELVKLLINENTQESNDKAKQIVDNITNNLQTSKIRTYTNCITINAILTYKIDEASNIGITIKPEVLIENSKETCKNIDNYNIDVLLLNMLNNAIDACNKLDNNEEKIIKVKIATKGNFLFIKTVNPFRDIIYDDNHKLKTTKKDKENHGLGMSIIQQIIRTYNGNQTITTDNNVFTHIISLDLQSKSINN